jgi:hypothetical protein
VLLVTADDAIHAVTSRYYELPPLVHTDTPRTVYSRIISATLTPRIPLSHGQAVHLAALAVALVVAVDRAELVDVTSGREE